MLIATESTGRKCEISFKFMLSGGYGRSDDRES